MIPTADQGTCVTLEGASDILGPQFFACPAAMAILNSQSVSKEALSIMRQIFETSEAARTDMAAFLECLGDRRCTQVFEPARGA